MVGRPQQLAIKNCIVGINSLKILVYDVTEICCLAYPMLYLTFIKTYTYGYQYLLLIVIYSVSYEHEMINGMALFYELNIHLLPKD